MSVRRGSLEEDSEVILDEVCEAVGVGWDAQGHEVVDVIIDSFAAAPELRSVILAATARGIVEEPVS